MRIEYCITKTIDTLSEYVIFLGFYDNSGYANALYCYFIRILPFLSASLDMLHGGVFSSSYVRGLPVELTV